jgi:hypothetical protein
MNGNDTAPAIAHTSSGPESLGEDDRGEADPRWPRGELAGMTFGTEPRYL